MKRILFALALLTASTSGAAEPVQLFNGRDLTGWKTADLFEGGKVAVLPDGAVECDFGNPMTGIAYTNTPPRMNYELSLQAVRVQGSDFFVALTLPIETNYCTIIIGGWGGNLCGISSVDYLDASENQWSENTTLENERWYTLRVRVTPGVLQVFLDETLYTARVEGPPSRFSLRSGSDIDKTGPLGLASYRTKARWRNFTLTPITELGPKDKPMLEE
ncbi:MAG TPA: DUF1080 domain-containing protein [Kiritimatiellia bacterium]|jgi:hypothetical protein|nr:MAG: hypothetical protein BWX70_00421 [Verrucomicrobia bacterium ADurb.Bin070]HPB11077.1 DUF1080 domain-containing protein [Kiritimatiellia bacterium]HPO37125.1 DUF1080 domain-containing protein [Kiritimatiellia bacterium]HQL49689.1 DUF1080 domain-containing protein [Kiritimatiellia bacterium]HQQ90668.1 DUF1080 domain-containing protein [Kiritimatiellia bacterium]